jgi:hypothetical protein
MMTSIDFTRMFLVCLTVLSAAYVSRFCAWAEMPVISDILLSGPYSKLLLWQNYTVPCLCSTFAIYLLSVHINTTWGSGSPCQVIAFMYVLFGMRIQVLYILQ